jgi:radical SAM protein with 4Fe4S-binding SPASM domain
LLEMSNAREAGHQVTLLSTTGFRRGQLGVDKMPPASVSAPLLALWKKHPHLGFFREYFEHMDDFLAGGPMPTCSAGAQSFNIDHIGNVSPCIERIDWSFGNVKQDSLRAIHARMKTEATAEVSTCQRCWTACRGMSQALSKGGSPRALYDLATRMKS